MTASRGANEPRVWAQGPSGDAAHAWRSTRMYVSSSLRRLRMRGVITETSGGFAGSSTRSLRGRSCTRMSGP
jgi:hypothetical protein